MPDDTDKLWQVYLRNRRHRHNAHLGSLSMARHAMNDIMRSSSTTEDAKILAAQIASKLMMLTEISVRNAWSEYETTKLLCFEGSETCSVRLPATVEKGATFDLVVTAQMVPA